MWKNKYYIKKMFFNLDFIIYKVYSGGGGQTILPVETIFK